MVALQCPNCSFGQPGQDTKLKELVIGAYEAIGYEQTVKEDKFDIYLYSFITWVV